MTDLDRQLRDCLSRHAADAPPAGSAAATDLVAGAHRRSRQLGRRAPLTVAAVAPLTAAAVFGATALAHSPSSREQLRPHSTLSPQARPGATGQAEPLTTATGTPVGFRVCATGRLPNLHEKRTSDVKPANRLVSERQFVALESRLHHGQIRTILVTPHGIALDGHGIYHHRFGIGVELKNGRHLWSVARYQRPSGRFLIRNATYLGCVKG